ncbi:MAG: 50S ribosomal protein L13 [Deltaproteobacteria bacterium]|nr:50S ribosomal protein L13 [Deltaproteobacteria bacterium]
MSSSAHRATKSAREVDVKRRWLVVDAEGQVLGRLAARVASILRGKHKAIFTPHVDTGDFVIVINAEKVKLTGNKLTDKVYRHHTGWRGHVKETNAGKLLAGPHADRVVSEAVRGMLPKNHLGRKMLDKLKVYAGPKHPHDAQRPEVLSLG